MFKKMLSIPAWVWAALGVDALCLAAGVVLGRWVLPEKGPELYSLIGAALGAIFAVAGGVLVAMMQSAKHIAEERKKVERQGHGIAVLIRQPISNWRHRTDKPIPREENWGYFRVVDELIIDLDQAKVFEIPSTVSERLLDLWTLGATGEKILSCASRVHELRQLKTTIARLPKTEAFNERIAEGAQTFFALLKAQVQQLDEASKELDHEVWRPRDEDEKTEIEVQVDVSENDTNRSD